MLVQQEKMAVLNHILLKLLLVQNKRQLLKKKLAIQQEQMELYKLNNVSLMGGIGSDVYHLDCQSGVDSATRFYYQTKFQVVISWESTLEHNSYTPIAQHDNGGLCSREISSQPNGIDEETEKTKSFNELHSSSNDDHDDFQYQPGLVFTSLSLPLFKFYNHGFKTLIFVRN